MGYFDRLPKKYRDRMAKYTRMADINPNVDRDTVPMAVADMEFETAPPIKDGLKEYLDSVVLGYSGPYPEYMDAVISWQKRKFGYDVEEDWIVPTPGVVNGFTGAMRAFTDEGDGVILFRPVYHPMIRVVEESNRTLVNVPLINEDYKYSIDFGAFEEAAKDPKNKVLLFCSPHNPVGRVWTAEELEKIGTIALENDLIIISDEIWEDLIVGDTDHTVLAAVSPEIEDITITCTAPSKTFNVAGLCTSNLIVSNKEIREKLINELEHMGSLSINILGYKACELAYTQCDDWLDQLLVVLEKNKEIIESYCDKWGLGYSDMEGTYVFWADFNGLGLSNDELEQLLRFDAEIFTNDGDMFGAEGSGYQRFNLALPTDVLVTQLDRLDRAIDINKKER